MTRQSLTEEQVKASSAAAAFYPHGLVAAPEHIDIYESLADRGTVSRIEGVERGYKASDALMTAMQQTSARN